MRAVVRFPTWFAFCSIVVLSLAACWEDPSSLGPRPRFSAMGPGWSSDVCEMTGDFFTDVSFQVDDCSLAVDGFQDEAASFQFTDHPHFIGSHPLRVYWVWELRHGPHGVGRRLADVGWAPDSAVTTNVITVQLISELKGVSLYTWYGACPAGTSTPELCMSSALATGDRHDEPFLCIWNPTVGADGDVDSWCVGGGDGYGEAGTTNALPTAGPVTRSFDTYVEPLEYPCQDGSGGWRWCVRYGQYDYDATASSDPESTGLTYYYSLSSGGSGSNTTGTWYGYPSVDDIRLLVEDAAGGVDLVTAHFGS